jgi:glycosyltransferase involved in cell wall biosynthesis
MTGKTSNPTVSIITPSFNQADYLEDTIRSVLSQDYLEVEYMVIDGGSQDGSQEIIQKYAPALAWWVSEMDEGQAEAINKGLRRSKGEIVAWLNSDDLYLPGAISSAVKALRQTPEAGMVYGDAITIDGQGRPLKFLRFPKWGLQELMGFRIICQPAVFMRRSVLERVGFLDPTYDYMLDHHLWLRIALKAPVQHVPGVWAAARHHSGAKNVSHAVKFAEETQRLLEWMNINPEYSGLIEDQRYITGGAYRLRARYLLDGGLPADSLRAYFQAFLLQPGYTLKHWHRVTYALFSLVGGDSLARLYHRLRGARRPKLDFDPGVNEWPGLQPKQQRG